MGIIYGFTYALCTALQPSCMCALGYAGLLAHRAWKKMSHSHCAITTLMITHSGDIQTYSTGSFGHLRHAHVHLYFN
jgi:hypothetical protein